MMDAAPSPLLRARHDLSRGRPDLALAALEHVRATELETLEFWRIRADALLRLGLCAEAHDAARTGLDRVPNDVHLLVTLALAFSGLRRKKEALDAMEAAVALEPDGARLHAQRAFLLTRHAQNAVGFASYRLARKAATRALELDGDCFAAHLARVQVAVASGERDAHKLAAQLLELAPENEQAHALAGIALTNRGRAHAGARHYTEAARLDPTDPEPARLLRGSRTLRHPVAFVLRLFWRLGPLPVLLAIFVLTVASLVLFLTTGIELPLAILGVFFIPFFWYLFFVGNIARGNHSRRPR
jgi:tetratricopeptide (TPR) repeat protein